MWLSVAKNASTSFEKLFTENNWTKRPLLETPIAADTKIFGHISDPNKRHTKGLSTYLIITNQMHLLDDATYQRLLISSVFDTHGYSISSMIPTLVDRVHWIPIDYMIEVGGKVFNGIGLTNLYFLRETLPLRILDKDLRENQSNLYEIELRQKIKLLKDQYQEEYKSFQGNILENDIKLYRNAIAWHTHHINYIYDAGIALDFI